MIDYVMKFVYAEIDLNDNSCIISPCNHILTLKSMDGHMNIAKYYTISENTEDENSIIELKSSSILFSISKLKNYPLCRNPLRNINRYERIVRRA